MVDTQTLLTGILKREIIQYSPSFLISSPQRYSGFLKLSQGQALESVFLQLLPRLPRGKMHIGNYELKLKSIYYARM